MEFRFLVTFFAFAFGPAGIGALPALAAPPSYAVEKVAHEGDATPSAGTITQLYGDASIDDDGRVAFYAIDSGATQVLFLWDGSALSVAVAEGDVAPDTGGALVLSPARARLAAPDLLAYAAIYDAPGPPFGSFLRDGESDSALLLPGAIAPGGGVVTEVDWTHDVGEAGTAAFAGSVDPGGGAIAAHFVATPGAVSEVYRDGDTTPIGGVFSGVQSYHTTALAADDSLVFAANVSGGSASSALFRWQGGSTSALVSAGDVIPVNGGTIEAFAPWASSNEQGHVAFVVDVLLPAAAFATEGVYLLADGVIHKVIQRDDPVPGTSPPMTFLGLLGSTPPEPSGNGVTTFTALLEDAAFTPHGAVIAEHGGVPKAVVLTGDPVPGVPGAVFTDFSDARTESAGRIVFTANTSLGTGVFLATPQPVNTPAMSEIALLCSAITLAYSGIVLLRPRKQRPAES